MRQININERDVEILQGKTYKIDETSSSDLTWDVESHLVL
jgi:hypothetical protein